MKGLGALMVLMMLLCLPGYSLAAGLGELRISLIDGDVQIKTEDTDDWVPASINMPLRSGDRLWVPGMGKAELQLRDGTLIRLDEQSALEILTLERGSYQFYLTEGRVYVNFRGTDGNVLQLDGPSLSLRTYEPSSFGVDVYRDGRNEIAVYRGEVLAESEHGKTRVEAGKALILSGRSYAEVAPVGLPDAWEQWNMERDRRPAEVRPPSRYLPQELQAYSGDFEANGQWVSVREYGYVWRPALVVSAGWAPYRVGRWVWVGGDYVWISYEPWGWVPYHYGRWAFVASLGWCWVPPLRGAVYWGPGFVGWVQTPTCVAWVPLAPGEIYYGYGYYGPHSVNIINVNITQINVTKVVYKHVHVHNAVTAVHHDTFLTGRHVDLPIKENPFVKRAIHVGRPNIRPEKATVMPVVRDIPESRRPPAGVREIRVRELKEKRPMVKAKEASALRPEVAPRDLPLKTVEKRRIEQPMKSGRPGQSPVMPKEARPQGEAIATPKELKRPGGVTVKPKEPDLTEKNVGRPSQPSVPIAERSRETKAAERRDNQRREAVPLPEPTERQVLPVKGKESPRPSGRAVEAPREPRSTGKKAEQGLPRATESRRRPEDPGTRG